MQFSFHMQKIMDNHKEYGKNWKRLFKTGGKLRNKVCIKAAGK